MLTYTDLEKLLDNEIAIRGLNEQLVNEYIKAIQTSPNNFFQIKDPLSEEAAKEFIKKVKLKCHPDKWKVKHSLASQLFVTLQNAFGEIKISEEKVKNEDNSVFSRLIKMIQNNIDFSEQFSDEMITLLFLYRKKITTNEILILSSEAVKSGRMGVYAIIQSLKDHDNFDKITDTSDEKYIIKQLTYAYRGDYINYRFQKPGNPEEIIAPYRKDFKNLNPAVKKHFLFLSASYDSAEQFQVLCQEFTDDELKSMHSSEEYNSLLHQVTGNFKINPQENLKKVKFLCPAKFAINAKNQLGKTAVHLFLNQFAVFVDLIGLTQEQRTLRKAIDIDMLNYFLDNGALIDIKDNNEQSPLEYALIHNLTEAVDLIVQKQKINWDPAWLWLVIDNLDSLKWLITKLSEGSLLMRDIKGNTLLHVAAVKNKNVVEFLLDQYPSIFNVNMKNNFGQTPLLMVGGVYFNEIFPILEKRGADINATDNNGETILFRAVREKSFRLIEILLNKGIRYQKDQLESILKEIQPDYNTKKQFEKLFGKLDLGPSKLKAKKQKLLASVDSSSSLAQQQIAWSQVNSHQNELKQKLSNAIAQKNINDVNNLFKVGYIQLYWNDLQNNFAFEVLQNIINTNDNNKIFEALLKYTNANYLERYGQKLLLQAIKQNNIFIVKLLLEAKNDLAISTPELKKALENGMTGVADLVIGYQKSLKQEFKK